MSSRFCAGHPSLSALLATFAAVVSLVPTPCAQVLSAPVARCASRLQDQATGNCSLRASSVPTPGMLFPLGAEFSVNPAGDTSAMGIVESRSGGFRFPDGTIQTTAASPAGAGRTPVRQPDLPLTITAPGVYVVVEPLVGVEHHNGITIDSDDVVLDLNGFTLSGGLNTLDGVHVTSGPRRGVFVQNGAVRGWGGDGVDAAGGSSTEHVITLRGLSLLANSGQGIRAGSVVHVLSCMAEGNSSVGISVGGQCLVHDNLVRRNGSHAIVVENACTVLDNYVWHQFGGSGIRVEGHNTVVRDNVVGQCNLGVEVLAGLQALVVRNTASACTSAAYSVGSGLGGVTSDPSSALPWGNFSLP